MGFGQYSQSESAGERLSLRAMLSEVIAAPDSKPEMLARNTMAYLRPNGWTAIRYHHTDIASNLDDVWRLHVDGWHTVTTLARLTRYTPARVITDKGQWWIIDSTQFPKPWREGAVLRAGIYVNAPDVWEPIDAGTLCCRGYPGPRWHKAADARLGCIYCGRERSRKCVMVGTNVRRLARMVGA